MKLKFEIETDDGIENVCNHYFLGTDTVQGEIGADELHLEVDGKPVVVVFVDGWQVKE